MEVGEVDNLSHSEHKRANQVVLEDIEVSGLNYNYTRTNMLEKLVTSEAIKSWNNDMVLWQKLRIRASLSKENAYSDDNLLIVDSEDYSSSSGSGTFSDDS